MVGTYGDVSVQFGFAPGVFLELVSLREVYPCWRQLWTARDPRLILSVTVVGDIQDYINQGTTKSAAAGQSMVGAEKGFLTHF